MITLLLLWIYLPLLVFAILFGITPSISQIYYEIIRRWPKAGWIFTVWFFGIMFLVAGTLIPALENKPYQFLGFFTSFGLGLVGAAPLFKDASQKYIHFGGAVTSAACAVALAVLEAHLISLAVIACVSFFVALFTPKDDNTYWAEIAIITSGCIIILETNLHVL